MKNIFFVLLFIGNYSFAQTDYQIYPQSIPTQFDTFINKPTVRWAIYAHDTLHILKPNLSSFLIEQMQNGKIKTTKPVYKGTDEVNDLHYTAKNENDSSLYFIPLYDSVGTLIGQRQQSRIDSLTYGVLDITQIFYIDDCELKSYIPWVAPTLSLYAGANGDNYLGRQDYFNTCLNFKFDFSPSLKDSVMFLTRTKRRMYADSINKADKLKELYGRNLLETLWQPLIENKLRMFSVDSNKEVNPNGIIDYFTYKGIIEKPHYDIAENYEMDGVAPPTIIQLSDSFFKETEVVQNWYYDYTQNIVYNKITELYIYIKKIENGQIGKESYPILKVVFN